MQFTINIPDDQVQRVADWIKETRFQVDEQVQPPAPVPTNAELLAEFKRLKKKFS